MVPSPLRRRSRRLCALVAPLLLSSCFTMGLWGFLPETETSPWTGKDDTSFVYDEETE
jgi:hypothetical protein